ncbi:Uncharacterised protein [Staphylococcus piscifermentans]|uniref:Pyrimidine dimer DNA glycosylase n=1 Tax=Staphylococcus piscifermentans TaxID=70258 RepID=A0A239UCW5_9STAP|nr:pyrimidine dimer DNA glycosylase/endonuclease V [Staphylococcus piscifermentans]RTX86432.1 hypothetical protein CD139_01000 [Staphylococcus piscifermentans]GEP84005.1 hypothetical protein SPI02_05900 [Staphylococcus piscifermentans]SNV07499.1 Uncharacterised protein [Staphylococcus piscifermentans]
MQIFRVSPNPNVSAEFLDNRRLSKQVLELYQIIRVCLGELGAIQTGTGYRNHPVVKAVYNEGNPYLWGALEIMDAMNREHLRRGGNQSEHFKNELADLRQIVEEAVEEYQLSHAKLPPFYVEGKVRIEGDEAYELYQKLLYKKWRNDKIPPRCNINLKNKGERQK